MILFKCGVCAAKEKELEYLRDLVRSLQKNMLDSNNKHISDLMTVQKDCNDRIMSRSYTEFAVGQATESSPVQAFSRSDEEEWKIEQDRKLQLQRDALSAQGNVNSG